jgi:hypothetical protein
VNAATEIHYPEHSDRPTWVVTVVRQRNGRELVILAGPLMGAAEGTWDTGLLGTSWSADQLPTAHRIRYLNLRFFGSERCEVDASLWLMIDRMYRAARSRLGHQDQA